MQVSLTRLLRDRHPRRVFIGLADAAHSAALGRALGDWPLARYVASGRAIALPDDAGLPPEALEVA
jgi:hypothetical protein